jgi:acetyl-CoA carboxylase beta subunit
MSLTVKQLKNRLNRCPEDMIIVDHENRDFVHIINMDGTPQRLKLSAFPKIGECKKCGGTVHETEVENYSAVCTQCDENLYNFEFFPIKKQ